MLEYCGYYNMGFCAGSCKYKHVIIDTSSQEYVRHEDPYHYFYRGTILPKICEQFNTDKGCTLKNRCPDSHESNRTNNIFSRGVLSFSVFTTEKGDFIIACDYKSMFYS